MSDHERVFRCVERHVARALAAGKGTDWPTVAIVARRLRMSHGAVEAACDGDPDGRIFLSGYNMVGNDRHGEPHLGSLYVESDAPGGVVEQYLRRSA